MANRYLIATGNSDNPAIYDGGTLPDPADVLRLNGFVLTVVANMTLAELRCDALAPAVASDAARQVLLANGVTLTVTNLVSGTNVASNTGMIGCVPSASATIVSTTFQRQCFRVLSGETLTAVGSFNCNVGTGTTFGGMVSGGGVVNMTGPVISSGCILDGIENTTLNITGPITVSASVAFNVNRAGNPTITVTGDITCSGFLAVSTTLTTRNAFTHYGSLRTTGSANAFKSSSIYRGTGPFINNGSYCAFAGDRLELIPNGGTYIEAVTTTPTTVRLYTPDLLSGYPAIADVESGVIYGPSNEFTGTLSPVNINTAQLATDLLTEMNTSNLTIAQGLRDGMGASAAAIAAVGSINVIP
jgi:hypothetical protein